MITANQSEILRAANRLKEAREALLNATSLICMNESQRIHIHTMVSEIDSLFGELISGEVPKAKSRKGGAADLAYFATRSLPVRR